MPKNLKKLFNTPKKTFQNLKTFSHKAYTPFAWSKFDTIRYASTRKDPKKSYFRRHTSPKKYDTLIKK